MGSKATYAGINLLFDGVDDLIDASPLVLVLGTALDNAEALEDVDDVVDASALYTELFGALVQVEEAALRGPVEEQKTTTKLTEALLFAIVGCTLDAIVVVIED